MKSVPEIIKMLEKVDSELKVVCYAGGYSLASVRLKVQGIISDLLSIVLMQEGSHGKRNNR